MDSLKCQAVIEAVDRASFTGAASRMGYTPSGIARMVDSLEAELGFALLRRTRRGVSLTSEGERLEPALRAFVRAGQQISAYASDIRGIAAGEVEVGSYYSIASHWLPRVISAFREEYPGVRVDLRGGGNAALADFVAAGRLDCCFTSNRLVDCDWIPLLKDEMVAWVPPSWPEAEWNTFPVAKIRDYPYVQPIPEWKTDAAAILADNGIEADVRFTAEDGYSMWRMVEAGLGMSINNALTHSSWTGNVAVIPLRPRQYVHLGIAVPDMSSASPATRAFIECAVRVIRGLGAGSEASARG